jgi:hypothetical protein
VTCHGPDSIEPLSWPRSLQAPTWLESFLTGTPLIGPDRRACRNWRRAVAARPEAWKAMWPTDELVTRARERIGAILVDRLSWRQPRFVPGDPLNILLFFPSMGSDDANDIIDIEELLGRELTEEEIHWWTLGDLVQQVAQADLVGR